MNQVVFEAIEENHALRDLVKALVLKQGGRVELTQDEVNSTSGHILETVFGPNSQGETIELVQVYPLTQQKQGPR